MKKFIKENKSVVITGLIVLGFLFYWFQLRPTFIKQNCSQEIITIPADLGVTSEQAVQNKINYTQCKLKYPLAPFNKSFEFFTYMRMIEDSTTEGQREEIKQCDNIGKNITERASSRERKEKRSVSEKEYSQCLREHGL